MAGVFSQSERRYKISPEKLNHEMIGEVLFFHFQRVSRKRREERMNLDRFRIPSNYLNDDSIKI
jgi:hypothetical protein